MRRNAILLIAVLATVVLLLLTGVPLGVPGEWVWKRQQVPEDLAAVLDRLSMPLLTGTLLVFFCRLVDNRITEASRLLRVTYLFVLVLGAVCWLSGVRQAAASPHREIRPLWVLYDKYASGYFFNAAFSTTSTRELLATYEERVAEGNVLHEGTHPPGLLLLNRWALQSTRDSPFLTQISEWTQSADSVRLFRSVESAASMARPLTRSEIAALCLTSSLSSLLCAMTLLPVYGIVSLLSDDRTAWRAACLMITIPSIAVFAPRSDVVYAFSGSLLLWLILKSLLDESWMLRLTMAFFAGLTGFVCLSVSLAHIPILVVAAVFSVLLWQAKYWPRGRAFGAAAVMATTFAISVLCWNFVTGCNLLRVWVLNLSNHGSFYDQYPRTWWKWILVNLVEVSFAAGLPIAAVCVISAVQAVKLIWRSGKPVSRNSAVIHMLTFSMIFTWAALWLSGKNAGEAARLWCFLTPWFVLVACLETNSGLRSVSDTSSSLQVTSSHSYDPDRWLKLLIAQFVVCMVSVGLVSGYEF